MVFIGGWQVGGRRRPYYPYGRRGYGYGNNSCLRDLCLVETGCCLAESLGCGPQLTLLAPSVVRRSFRSLGRAESPHPTGGPAMAEGHRRQGPLVRLLLTAISVYQTEISAHRSRPCCRYSPSCSVYAVEALQRHGLLRGLRAGRVLRGRPGSPGGSDPVPPGAGRR
jgi:putative membrane protein insertion efficiency factor